jgi:hypothetical protein
MAFIVSGHKSKAVKHYHPFSIFKFKSFVNTNKSFLDAVHVHQQIGHFQFSTIV